MYYSREEQETDYIFDPINDNWRVYSTYPPDIRKLLKHANIYRREMDDKGRIIAVEGHVFKNQIRLFKPRL